MITGASSGLGAGFARAFAAAGASVVLGARRTDALESVANQLRANGHSVATQGVDITVPEDASGLIRHALDTFGKVDILINNAGVGTAVPALREAPDAFRSVIDVNLNGAFWMAQAAARVMESGSSIVNIASILGMMKSYAPQAAYAASKAAVSGLTRDLSQQWAGRKGIRVNAIAPGYFASEMTSSIPDGLLSDFINSRADIKRLGRQEELDSAVLFLASDAASYITGITLPVDGGMTGH